MYRENSSQNKMSRIEKAKSGGFLDTWFGRPRNKSTSGYSSVRIPGSGNTSSYMNTDGVSTGPSESGFENEDSHLSILEKLDEDALCQEFENMLNDMNLSEEKKEPLRLQPLDNKRKMVINQYKKKFQENKLKWDRPTDYISYLGQDPPSNKLYACMESLRIALKNNPLSWTEEFGTQGLKQVLNVLSDCYRNNEYHKVQLECLRCVTALMNNTKGVKTIFKLKESLHIVAKSLDPNQPNCMTETLKILAAISLLEDGHEKVLEAITAVSEIKAIPRFQSMIQALMSKHNEQLRTACFQLINALISQADDLDFRLHIRNEFMRTGLIDIIETLKQDASADLTVQLNVFEDRKEDDYEEFCARFDHVRLEIEDVNDCFELIKNLTLETPAEPYFLSILQHLLFIRDDYNIRPAYFKLIEEAVTQIVLHKNGLDPDFQYKKKFEIDIQPLIDNLVEKEKFQAEESKKLEEMLARIEKEISLRQETEAKLAQAESRLEALGAGNIPVMNNVAAIAKNINIPPPPLMPGMGGPIPPPAPPVPPPMSGMCPPPPPLPGMGPPPPPLPGMGGPPPPPPFFGMPGAPPPPLLMKAPDILPHGLKPKKKWDTNGPLKRANWKAIIPQKMSDKAFWIRCQEDKLASPDILIGLAERFSSKPPVKKIDDVVDKSGTMKKIKDLKVLDGKAAQNISILLGGSLKHLSYDDVKTCILRCDDTVLGDNVLQQLIQYLPPPDQLKKLQEYKDKYNELTGAEQFCITIAEIKRLLPRLKSLSFRLHYTEMVQDIKPDIVAGTAACEEIKSSKKFAKLLELILLVGNYMNSGSKNGEAFGFEISFLTKLTGTKDFENKQTLLHYLVETVENKFPDILNFHDELSHVDKASRVSLDNIQKTLRQMESNIKNLETDLVNSKVPQSDDDKFNDIMALFAKEAREQCSVLQNMFKQMDSLYTDISEYYAFDKQKYTLEEFFTDIKTFKDAFINAHKDNIKLREQEEKSKRAKLSREMAEKEKHERALRKKQLVDMNAAQEGVMDSLLEALQTGSAFSREQKRKRGPRVAGAERRAQLNRSRSRSGLVGPSSLTRELSSELISA